MTTDPMSVRRAGVGSKTGLVWAQHAGAKSARVRVREGQREMTTEQMQSHAIQDDIDIPDHGEEELIEAGSGEGEQSDSKFARSRHRSTATRNGPGDRAERGWFTGGNTHHRRASRTRDRTRVAVMMDARWGCGSVDTGNGDA